jgi:3-oxoacyl-[acyl-carrier-protein] synthase II
VSALEDRREPTRQRVAVTGIGLLTPLGDDLEAVHGALLAGETGLGDPEGLDLDELAAKGAPSPCPLVGEVRGFDPARYVGRANFRPLDRTGQLVVAAARLALDRSGRERSEDASADGVDDEELGLVLGTMFGSVRTIAEFDRRALTAGPNYVKPFDFANSVINAAAGQAAIWHGLRGVNATIAGGTAAGLQALGYAADLVATGGVRGVLAGGADELSAESVVGFARSKLTCGANGDGPRPVPFDERRDGFAPSEGAALLMLEPADGASRRGVPELAEILGHGASFDPTRGGDEASAGTSLARAVTAALAEAAVEPGDLDAVAVSASGSSALDRAEARGLVLALGESARTLPVLAPKAALGEALGASGALAAALLVQSLRTGRVPGIRGFEVLENGLDLGGARAETTTLTEAAGPRRGLVTALDRHGGAHALVLAVPALASGDLS